MLSLHAAAAVRAAARARAAWAAAADALLPTPARPAAPPGALGARPPHRRPLQPQQLVLLRRPFFSLPGLPDGGSSSLAQSYHERKLMGWPPAAVFAVVADVGAYAEFVPWCRRSVVVARRAGGGGADGSSNSCSSSGRAAGAAADELDAELEVGFQLFVERYTSRVRLSPPRGGGGGGGGAGAGAPAFITSQAGGSALFRRLANRWEFAPGPAPGSCWLDFRVEFEFRSPLHQAAASLFFDEVVRRMVGAFEGRCAHVHGPSSLRRGIGVAAGGGGGGGGGGAPSPKVAS